MMLRLAWSLLMAIFFIPNFELVYLPDNPNLKPPTKEDFDKWNQEQPVCQCPSEAASYCSKNVFKTNKGICAPMPGWISQKFLCSVAHSDKKMILCTNKTGGITALVARSGNGQYPYSVWYPFNVDPSKFGINNLE